MELLLSKVADDRIEIMGAADIPDALREVVGTGEVKYATTVSADKIDELDKVITQAIMGGERHLDYVKFAHPIVIARTSALTEKKASAHATEISEGNFKVHLPEAFVKLMAIVTEPDLTKRASDAEDFMAAGTPGKGSDFLDALSAGKMDGQGMFGFSMPIKLEFANESVKNAFMGLNERYQKSRKARQQKAASVVGAIKRVYLDQVKKMAGRL